MDAPFISVVNARPYISSLPVPRKEGDPLVRNPDLKLNPLIARRHQTLVVRGLNTTEVVLNMPKSNFVFKTILCCCITVETIIDTGSGLTVVSSNFVKK